MPQFDFTTYSAQIFWFGICFFALYYSMAKVILPRIRSIISDRKHIIGDDNFSAKSLNEKSDEVRIRANDLLAMADARYKSTIDDTVRKAAQSREKSLAEFKISSEKLIHKSQTEIDQMIQESEKKNRDFIDQVVILTQNKLFNS